MLINWPDFVNGSYELLGGFAVGLSVWRLWKDKEMKGASFWTPIFFFTWGLWNLYYYPHLDQWISFVGGVGVTVANFMWLHLLLYYGGAYRSWFNEPVSTKYESDKFMDSHIL